MKKTKVNHILFVNKERIHFFEGTLRIDTIKICEGLRIKFKLPIIDYYVRTCAKWKFNDSNTLQLITEDKKNRVISNQIIKATFVTLPQLKREKRILACFEGIVFEIKKQTL